MKDRRKKRIREEERKIMNAWKRDESKKRERRRNRKRKGIGGLRTWTRRENTKRIENEKKD